MLLQRVGDPDFQNPENTNYPLPMKSAYQMKYKGNLIPRLTETLFHLVIVLISYHFRGR